MKRADLRRWLPALASLTVIAVLAVWLRQQADSIPAAITLLHQAARAHPWVVLLAFALRPFVLFPISLLVISTGMLFDFPAAYAIGWAGQTLSGLTGFAAVRFLVPTSADDDGGFAARWRTRLEEQAFASVLLMRVLLLPYDIVNYGCAWLRTPWRPYLLATAIGIIPANLALVGIGASINLDAFAGGAAGIPLDSLLDARQLAFSAALVIVSLVLARYVKRRNRDVNTP